MKMRDERSVLQKMGLDFQLLDSGCCGMAGAFGFEKDHYDVSLKLGERVLLPAVREADKETLIIADGFSCRCQIEHGTDRRALHLAEVLHMAARQGDRPAAGPYPEVGHVQVRLPGLSRPVAAAVLTGGLLAAGALGWLAWRK
jgi:hypothetical protein